MTGRKCAGGELAGAESPHHSGDLRRARGGLSGVSLPATRPSLLHSAKRASQSPATSRCGRLETDASVFAISAGDRPSQRPCQIAPAVEFSNTISPDPSASSTTSSSSTNVLADGLMSALFGTAIRILGATTLSRVDARKV